MKILSSYKKTIIAAALSLTLTICAVSFSVSGKNNTLSVQKEVYRLLGSAYAYGVTANSATINTDFESNLSTDKLIVTGTVDIGNTSGTYTNTGATSYIKDFVSGCAQLRSTDNLVLGTPFEDAGNNSIVLSSGSKVLFANTASTINISYNPDYMNVSETISQAGENISSLATDKNTDGVLVNLNDMNNAVIDITNCSEMICSVNLTLSQYKSIAIGGLKIYKNDDQALLINLINDGTASQVTDSTTGITTSAFDITRYFINGESSASDNLLNADTIIWNLTDFENTIISVYEGCGIFVAPKSTISVQSTTRGHAICNYFCNPGGEWHFLSDDLDSETSAPDTDNELTTKETTAEEITTEEVTTAETTTEEVTTAETITEEVTTGEIITEEVTTDEITTDEVTTGETITEEATTDEIITEEVTTGETTAEEVTTVETTAEETTTRTPEVSSTMEENTTETATKETVSEESSEETTTRHTEILGTEYVKETTAASGEVDDMTMEKVTDPEDPAGLDDTAESEDPADVDSANTHKSEVLSAEEINTGDNSHIFIYIILAVAALVALAGTAFGFKKKNK